MSLKLVTPPSVEPITLAQAKAHLRVSHDEEDTLISTLIGAVRQYLDGPNGFLQRALITQTWDLYLDRFPCNEIKIPLAPLQSVTWVKYDDDDGDEQTFSEADYTVDNVNAVGWVLPNSDTPWPTTYSGVNSVRVRFVAGYPDDGNSPPDLRANVPLPIIQWMLLQIGTLYAQRETIIVGQQVSVVPNIVDALIQPYIVYA